MSIIEVTTNRTNHEKMFELILKELGVKYEINQVYCFTCKGHYEFLQKKYPPFCKVTGHIIDGSSGGTYCKPDFIVKYGKGDKKLAVIEINGGIHDVFHQKKKFCNKISSLLNDKIKVFIIMNDEIDQFSKKELTETVKYWVRCMKSDKLYNEYIRSNQFREHSYLYMLPGFFLHYGK